jgi:hypothetical protein
MNSLREGQHIVEQNANEKSNILANTSILEVSGLGTVVESSRSLSNLWVKKIAVNG